jgi:hypothetical protein
MRRVRSLERVDGAENEAEDDGQHQRHDRCCHPEIRVQHQSTLIVFKGQEEVARSTGETDPTPLRSLVAKAF